MLAISFSVLFFFLTFCHLIHLPALSRIHVSFSHRYRYILDKITFLNHSFLPLYYYLGPHHYKLIQLDWHRGPFVSHDEDRMLFYKCFPSRFKSEFATLCLLQLTSGMPGPEAIEEIGHVVLKMPSMLQWLHFKTSIRRKWMAKST